MRRVGSGRIAQCIVIRVLSIAIGTVDDSHLTDVPEVASLLPIGVAAQCIPEARRVHSLASIVRRLEQVFRPEKMFLRIEDQHGVVRDRTPIVVDVVRAFGFGVIRSAVDREIPTMINGKVTAIQMLVFGKVRSAVKLDIGCIRIPPIAKDNLVDSREVPWNGEAPLHR